MTRPSSANIPNFVSAATPMLLRRKMLKVSAQRAAHLHVLSIVFEPEEKLWYCWFIDDIRKIEEAGEE